MTEPPCLAGGPRGSGWAALALVAAIAGSWLLAFAAVRLVYSALTLLGLL